MNKTIELSTGKIVDLSRFVALIPDDEMAENHQYLLILEGYTQSINLNVEEANSVKKHLQVDTEKKHNGTWDREEQLRLNQPKMKKLKEKIERMKQEKPSAEKADFNDQKLESNLDINSPHANPHWDEEAQLRKNQPLMKLVKQWQEKKSGNPPTEEEIREYQDIQKSLERNRFIEQTS